MNETKLLQNELKKSKGQEFSEQLERGKSFVDEMKKAGVYKECKYDMPSINRLGLGRDVRQDFLPTKSLFG